jgi:hypothetical protein
MDCSCSFSADVDGFCEMLDYRWVTARKPHDCHECGRKVVNGERYYREKTVYDGDIETHKTCADCKSIRDNLVADFFWGEVLDLVLESIRETGGEIPEKCIAKLTPAARAWVCARIEAQWEDDDA